jgi:hypothetical protein
VVDDLAILGAGPYGLLSSGAGPARRGIASRSPDTPHSLATRSGARGQVIPGRLVARWPMATGRVPALCAGTAPALPAEPEVTDVTASARPDLPGETFLVAAVAGSAPVALAGVLTASVQEPAASFKVGGAPTSATSPHFHGAVSP